MFSHENNADVARLAVKLVRAWKARKLYSTLGQEARTLYDRVTSYEDASKPKPYTDHELEAMRLKYIRTFGYSYSAAMAEVMNQVRYREQRIMEWEKNLA